MSPPIPILLIQRTVTTYPASHPRPPCPQVVLPYRRDSNIVLPRWVQILLAEAYPNSFAVRILERGLQMEIGRLFYKTDPGISEKSRKPLGRLA